MPPEAVGRLGICELDYQTFLGDDRSTACHGLTVPVRFPILERRIIKGFLNGTSTGAGM